MGTATDAFVKEKKTPLPSWSFRFLWNVKKCQIVAKKCKTILPWRILLLVLNTFQSIQRKKKKLSSQITHHIRKKRKLSLAFFTSSRNSFMSPSNHFKPSYRNGMLTIFPFNDKRSREKIKFFPITWRTTSAKNNIFTKWPLAPSPTFYAPLHIALGPPHSWRISLTMKPLSTRPKALSLLKRKSPLLTFVFATTTRISTKPCGIHALSRAPRFHSRFASSYTKKPHLASLRQSIRSQLQRHPFSGLGNSAGELLHYPEMVPTSMATFLLSKSPNTFCGIWVSWHYDTV